MKKVHPGLQQEQQRLKERASESSDRQASE